MRVVLTGASGFIGRVLAKNLQTDDCDVLSCSRSFRKTVGASLTTSPELAPESDWRLLLEGADVVVHLAGLSQVESGRPDAKTEQAYFRVNAEGTRTLAKQASEVGVRHFIFMSSSHAVAAQSNTKLSTESVPQPSSVYGRSKLAGERAVREALAGTGCKWTILRPPLVYGPENKGNFGLLLKLVRTGLPLPLASVRNKRSFLFVENLADAVKGCLENSKAFGKVFYPSDGRDISTPEVIKMIGDAAGIEARLFTLPQSLLRAAARMPGLGAVRKLTSSLFVDSQPMSEDLGWSPRFATEEGLKLSL
jgi:nucleoside-diphosphate-sugar epimerase